MIGTALRAAAAFVDDTATSTAWDQHQHLTDGQRSARIEKIRAVAHDLRLLADAAETRKVRYSEFEVLKDRLYAFGLSLLPKLALDVATAFHDAEGPAQPREKGWMKPS